MKRGGASLLPTASSSRGGHIRLRPSPWLVLASLFVVGVFVGRGVFSPKGGLAAGNENVLEQARRAASRDRDVTERGSAVRDHIHHQIPNGPADLGPVSTVPRIGHSDTLPGVVGIAGGANSRTGDNARPRKDIADDVDDDEWPLEALSTDNDFRCHGLHTGTSARCVSRGMQQKCFFRNLVVYRNQFRVYDPLSSDAAQLTCSGGGGGPEALASLRPTESSLEPIALGHYPNPIYPPDGQSAPLIQNHKYRGHRIVRIPHSQATAAPLRAVCSRVIKRLTLFLFRMSGHSTYHLWENNLGPFFATLQDSFDFDASKSGDREALRAMLNDPKKLLISFVDSKPRHGPKAPKLLDQLLRQFTNVPLLNASRVAQPTCIRNAVVGISASHFPHRQLVREIQSRMLNLSDGAQQQQQQPDQRLPDVPNIIYISRNHPSVTRGRKMVNEAEVYPVLNQTLYALTGKPVPRVFMEDLTFDEQIRMASRTQIILSPHGGGVANCIWMAPGSVVMEFVAPVGRTLPGMYHTMCGNSGVQHFHFLAEGDPADEGIKDNRRLFSNLVMPVDRMITNAKKALALYQSAVKKQNTQSSRR